MSTHQNETPQPEGLAATTGSVDVVPIKCVACGAEGEVKGPENMSRVDCECGAAYLYWPMGQNYGAKSPWKCVVRPIFAPLNTEAEHRTP